MPLSRDHRNFVEILVAEISSRLSQSTNAPLILDDLVYEIAREAFEYDGEATWIGDDIADDVIPAHSRRLVSFGYADYDIPGTSLELLDLDTGRVFVLVDRSQIAEGIAVLAEFRKDDTDALRTYVKGQIVFGASTGETLSAWPEDIDVFTPITNDDVLQVFERMFSRSRDACEPYVEFVTRASGIDWSLASVDDRLQFAKKYVSLTLGIEPSVPVTKSRPTHRPSTRINTTGGLRESDEVVVDPVSGRPLHEFVVSVPRMGAGITDGDLDIEDGVDTAPEGTSFADRLPGDIVIVDPRVPGQVEYMIEQVKASRRARLERLGLDDS